MDREAWQSTVHGVAQSQIWLNISVQGCYNSEGNAYDLFMFFFLIYKVLWKWKLLSSVRLFATPWTVARQAPLSTEFSRQEYWSG